MSAELSRLDLRALQAKGLCIPLSPISRQSTDVNALVIVTTLESHRAELTSRLLSLRAERVLTTTLPPSSTPTPPTDQSPSPNASQVSTIPDNYNSLLLRPPPEAAAVDDSAILAFALSRDAALESHTVQNLYRISGATTFIVPPSIPGEKHLLGIRIEDFATKGRVFRSPVYVFLEMRNGAFVIARHSAPAFIGIGDLGRVFFGGAAGNNDSDCNGGALGGVQNVDEFVKEVRRRMVLYRKRQVAVQELRENALAAGVIGDVTEDWTRRVTDVEWDSDVSMVTIKWMNGTVGRCRVDDKGIVVGAVVENGKGRRVVDIERLLVGQLDGIVEKVGWMKETV
jgi:hypothetical protein